jgi:putative tryptophan/tyrosine transport system substrate-binding protein
MQLMIQVKLIGIREASVEGRVDRKRDMQKKIEVITLTALFFAFCSSAEAQQPAKLHRIAVLSGGFPRSSPDIEALRQGLRDLGYVEGKNLVIEYRYAEANRDRYPDLLADLVRLKVDIIIGDGTGPAVAAKKATSTIPIVMLSVGDPVGLGLVASLARPGGNITGVSQMSPDLTGKRLELLKEILPKITRVAFIRNPDNPGMTLRFKEAQVAAPALGIKLQSLDVRSPNELTAALATATKEHAEALMLPASAGRYVKQIADFAKKERLPWTCDAMEFVELAGCLMAYGPSYPDLHRRAAIYVDKILKGVKPAELPVEQPTKFELIINLKAAKQMGLTIPPNVLARADRVIK